MRGLVADDVLDIVRDVFAAMVDGEESQVAEWPDRMPPFAEPVSAWVDMHGPWTGRAALLTDAQTADELTRVLLGLEAGSAVHVDDVADAFGEVANVVGGNIKSLLPTPGTLGLPQVARALPARTGAPDELRLSWRGRPLVVSVWAEELAPVQGSPAQESPAQEGSADR